MKFKSLFFKIIFILALSLTLISWGYQGHYKISYQSKLSYNSEMTQFMEWANLLAEHASDADERKTTDPDEGPKHYIDIDNYQIFMDEGRIPQTWDSVVEIYGESFVIDQGILPWATKTTYDSLVQCILRRDWDKAVLFASDLGHYIADGHMPLHITKNYNGQLSGNTGIHSRYESTMINAFIDEINYSGKSISFITDVNGYIFNYLYHNYIYVDSVLLADDYATEVAGSTNSNIYKEALWAKSKSFTVPLFSQSSGRLAELIYTAWVEAGKPAMDPSGIGEETGSSSTKLMQNFPNPFTSATNISFQIGNDADVNLTIVDASGKIVADLENRFLQKGSYQFEWDASDVPEGIYYLLLISDSNNNGWTAEKQLKKMLVMH